MDVSVVVASFGAPEWQELAESRAVPSAQDQAPVVRIHGDTLHGARNEGLRRVKTEFAIVLDADDELSPGYVEAMGRGTADVRAPAVSYIKPNGRPQAPYVPKVPGHRHACGGGCLPHGNWIVVGACVRTELAREAGFRDEELYEDWSLWLRCWLAGATVETVPQAVYRAHVRPDSRNRGPSRDVKEHWHRVIHESCFGKVAA